MPVTPGEAIPSYPTPQLADLALIELHDPTAPGYQVLRLESPHPDTVLYPNHRLVFQAPVEGVNNSLRRIYVNDRTAQDTYNVETTYIAEANAFPIFKREYLERRATYAPGTKGLPLTGVIKGVITAGGTGYEPSSANPVVSAATATISGAGTGATAIPLVDADGVIKELIIVTEGTGYTGVPTVAFGGGGSGATGTVAIQPVSALLVSEKQDKTGQDLTSRYVMATRVWMTLPGPVVSDQVKYDRWGNVITITEQEVATGAALLNNVTESQEYKGADSVRGQRLTELYPATFLQLTEIERLEGSVPGTRENRITYLVDALSTIPDDTATETYTRQNYEPDSDLKIETKVTTALPGPTITMNEGYDEYGNLIVTTVKDQPATAAAGVTDSAAQEQTYEGITTLRGRIITKTYPNSFAILDEIERVDGNVPGSRAVISTYFVTTASTIPADTATTTYVRHNHPTDSFLKIEIKTVYAIPADFWETEDQGHGFPELFLDFDSQDGWGAFYNFRPGISEIIPCRIVHSFGTTRQIPVPTIIREAQWRYPLGFTGRGLTMGETVIFAKNGSTLSLDLPDSIPDRDTYLAWIASALVITGGVPGTELLIGGSSRIWRAGIYHTMKIYAPPL